MHHEVIRLSKRFLVLTISLMLMMTLSACSTNIGKALSQDVESLFGSSEEAQTPQEPEQDPDAEPLIDPNTPGITVREFSILDSNVPTPLIFEVADQVSVAIWGYPELDRTAVIQPNGTITLPLIGEIQAAGLTVQQLREKVQQSLQPYSEVSPKGLRHGDILALRVWQHPDLSEDTIIDPDGMATLPLIGRINAANRSIDDVTTEATDGIREYIRDAQVTVIPTFSSRRTLDDYQVSVLTEQLATREIAVIGEVNSQGLLTINGSLRLLEALAVAGVREDTSDLNSVVVIRNSTGAEPLYQQMRVRDFLDGKVTDQNIYLQNDDIIIVPRNFITKVGTFVEQFFARTIPVFNFWTAMQSATVAAEASESVELINDSLRRGLLEITPTL